MEIKSSTKKISDTGVIKVYTGEKPATTDTVVMNGLLMEIPLEFLSQGRTDTDIILLNEAVAV